MGKKVTICNQLDNKLTGPGGAVHTPGHVKCPACEELELYLIQLENDFSRLPFNLAVTRWLEIRKKNPNLKPRTHETCLEYMEALSHFFGPMRLSDIGPGHLKAYQIARLSNTLNVDGQATAPWPHAAAHSRINHELAALSRILRHCRLWEKMRSYYFPLPIKPWSPREVLSEEDEEHLFQVAASCPDCCIAYWVACITNNTTASGIELRGLRLKHLFLRGKNEISEIYVPEDSVKNNSRPRKIALNRTARWAVDQCYRRALSLGACQPDHYLFPFRVKRNHYDPTRPPSRWFLRNSWNKLRQVTGFTSLNPHDLRHQCITRLLENGVEPETVRSIAGHVTTQMMEYYSHHRKETKFAAVMAIELEEIKRARKGPQMMRKRA